MKWFLSNKDKIKSKRLLLLLGDILRALANYVPLYKLSPNPVNDIAVGFCLSMMEDKDKIKIIGKYIPFYVLMYKGMEDEDDVSWPQSLTLIIQQIAMQSNTILTTLIFFLFHLYC